MVAKNLEIVVLAGDGVGPEVCLEAVRVLKVFNQFENQSGIKLLFKEALIGGCAIDALGSSLPDVTLEMCRKADAILLGAVGGPQWPKPPTPECPIPERPEQGLLKIRKELDLFANIRPCFFPGLSLLDYSPLKRDRVEGVEFTVVRELTSGIYFGSRIEQDSSSNSAHDTMTYTIPEIQRIARVAGTLSQTATPPLPITSIDKANVLATSRLWRRIVTETIEKEFPTTPLSHQLVDSAAMIMVCNPRKLNGIILTMNMFGDILSDESSVIPGSLGLLPSASMGANGPCMYEPIHGSAPDIAGKGIANPIGTILSVAMMFKHSLGLEGVGHVLNESVRQVIDGGCRTGDLGGTVGTSEVGDKVVEAFKAGLAKYYKK